MRSSDMDEAGILDELVAREHSRRETEVIEGLRDALDASKVVVTGEVVYENPRDALIRYQREMPAGKADKAVLRRLRRNVSQLQLLWRGMPFCTRRELVDNCIALYGCWPFGSTSRAAA